MSSRDPDGLRDVLPAQAVQDLEDMARQIVAKVAGAEDEEAAEALVDVITHSPDALAAFGDGFILQRLIEAVIKVLAKMLEDGSLPLPPWAKLLLQILMNGNIPLSASGRQQVEALIGPTSTPTEAVSEEPDDEG